jgi:hypothetical protein
MKKNPRRKSRKTQARIPFPRMLANVLVFVAVFGLSYVWLCARCDMLGQDIKRLESVRRETRLRMINEQDRWSNLLAPANFERALQRHRLAMQLPDERQIVRVRSGSRAAALALAYNRQTATGIYE